LRDPAGRERYDRSLVLLALAAAAESAHVAPPRWDWRRLLPAAIAIAAALLILVLGTSPAPHAPVAPRQLSPPVADDDWAPLATYAYEAHLPLPTVPLPEVTTRQTPDRKSGDPRPLK
jgi:hypothetical protein